MVESWRRAVAVTRFELDEVAEAEELFRTWLVADPRWGYGWVAWAVCHLSPAVRTGTTDLVEAERLLREGYSTPGVRDRDAVAEWLKILCHRTGRHAEARSFGRTAEELRRRAGASPLETGAVGVTEHVELEDGEGLVLRHGTTLTFGGEGLPLDQLPAVLDAMRSPERRPASRAAPKVGRNATCPCGSGKKFKRCCGPGPLPQPRPGPPGGGGGLTAAPSRIPSRARRTPGLPPAGAVTAVDGVPLPTPRAWGSGCEGLAPRLGSELPGAGAFGPWASGERVRPWSPDAPAC
ncbi:hypothetical protein GHK86_01210 [Acidimicrobiaceae bacterium USS-CC1]|uniref:SEC-C motif-containing protein n=1 Tax=Acidiferrimicrobium australe TaxID=2664430 RepID=A0ABW9QNK4_9ACTN|nr:hypothetical protein [Acidiferrimicrobium australe]